MHVGSYHALHFKDDWTHTPACICLVIFMLKMYNYTLKRCFNHIYSQRKGVGTLLGGKLECEWNLNQNYPQPSNYRVNVGSTVLQWTEWKERGGGVWNQEGGERVDLATSGINLSAWEAGGGRMDGRGNDGEERKKRTERTETKMRPQTHRRRRNAGNKTTTAKKGREI